MGVVQLAHSKTGFLRWITTGDDLYDVNDPLVHSDLSVLRVKVKVHYCDISDPTTSRELPWVPLREQFDSIRKSRESIYLISGAKTQNKKHYLKFETKLIAL